MMRWSGRFRSSGVLEVEMAVSLRSRTMVATAVALAMLPWQSLQAANLTCESDGYYRRCQVDTKAGVQLSRELGSVRCIQGDSWGFDDGGVWVDRGCKAEFKIGATGSTDSHADGGPRAMPPSPAPGPDTARADRGGSTGEQGGGIDTTTAVIGAVGVAAALGAAAALLGKNNDKDDHDNDRNKGRRKQIANAREACRDAASRDGYRNIEVTETDKEGRDVQIDLRMRRNGRNVRAVCDYDTRSRRARIYAESR